MMKTKWLFTLVAAALFALSASAGAAEVAIDNAGFEEPEQGDGGWSTDVVDGWTVTGTNVGGVYNPPSGAYGGNAPVGQQIAWVDGGELAQVLTETLTADSIYTLSVQVGNSPYYTSGDYVIELRAGGTVLADFGENAESIIPDNTFELRTVTYTYDPLDAALVGEPLEIRLIVDGAEVDFDDVKLDALKCISMDPSPADGATVEPASDLLLNWTNRDPNFPGQSVYVDVWFGTDPNHPSENWTKVVDAGENTTAWPVDASVDGTYYWQVNSYIYGSPTGDPCEGCVFTFNVVSDLPPTVDAGVDMITWSGEPVPLDATVVDDGVSDVTYLWTAVPADGVSWPDGADVRDPNVTNDKSGFLTTLVLNSGFESPPLADGQNTLAVSDWTEGWYDLSDPGVWTGYSYSAGVINPDAAYGYGGAANEGENVAYATSYVGYDMGLSQILSVALQAETQYDLSVKIGNPSIYNEGTTNDYRIELVAGDVVVASDTGPSPTDDTTWTTASLTHNSGSALTDPNVGQTLEIRLVAVDDGATGWEVNFDDVQLTATPAYPFPAVHTVTLTLAVHDEANPTPVEDIMTIDVYDNACLAAMGKDPTVAKTDLDGNCIANAKDLAAMLATWLVDHSLTAPVVLTSAISSVGSTNADNASSIVDGLVEYWELDGDYSAVEDPCHVGTLTTTGTGSGTFVSGKFGQGIDLENSSGNQAYIVIGGDENDFDFAGQSMSVALWYTTESLYTSWQALAAKGEGDGWRLHRQSGDATNINFVAGGSNARISGNGKLDQQDGSWHHVVATADTVSGLKIYVDGSEVASGSTPSAITDRSNAMQIGGNPDAAGRGWDGNIDDVGVWNRALTADEVASIWNGGIGRKIESLFDPNAPDVEAGHDWITLSGQTVTLAPTIVEQVPTDWINLTYLWSADPDTGVVFDPPAANVLAPTVTITKAIDNPSTVTLTLAAYGEGKPDPVADTMTIDVYEDACLAAKAAGSVAYDPGDFDENCITDLRDYAALATEWLVDYALKEPAAKP